MEIQHYPKWKYHKLADARIVKDAAEDKALGAEWKDSPADFEKPARKFQPKADVQKEEK